MLAIRSYQVSTQVSYYLATLGFVAVLIFMALTNEVQLSALPFMPEAYWWKLGHFGGFAILGGMLFLDIRVTPRALPDPRVAFATVVSVCAALGGLTELGQEFLIQHTASWFDFCIDTIGAATGLVFAIYFSKLAKPEDLNNARYAWAIAAGIPTSILIATIFRGN